MPFSVYMEAMLLNLKTVMSIKGYKSLANQEIAVLKETKSVVQIPSHRLKSLCGSIEVMSCYCCQDSLIYIRIKLQQCSFQDMKS